MATEQKGKVTPASESGIPEFEPPHRDDHIPDFIEDIGRGIVNAFTVERDTSLADGAGAPGSTSVGWTRRDSHEK